MKKISVSAPGKLHLLGEHSVIYGKPAIIAAVNKRLYVNVQSINGEKIQITLENLNKNGAFSLDEILNKTLIAKSLWEKYVLSNDIQSLKEFTSDSLNVMCIAIGETLRFYTKTIKKAFHLAIRSDIPIGSGMGSSGALAVAIAGAVSEFIGEGLEKEKINQIAFSIEQRMHGLPSGGDNSASCYGGLILYQNNSLLNFPKLSGNFKKSFSVIQTGIPVETTGEMVAYIRETRDHSKEDELKFTKIFEEQGKLVEELFTVLGSGEITEFIKIIRRGESNLEILGVVSDFAVKIIRSIEESGGAAKICGAGGRKEKSGIVLAFHANPDIIKKISREYNCEYMKIELGGEGLRIEK